MSSYRQPNIKAYKAGQDLSAYQYKFVKVGSSDDEVVPAGANEKTAGILMNAPTASGEVAEVARPGGGALLKINEAIDALDLLTPTSGALGEQCDADGEWCGAIAQAGGVQNDVIEVEVVSQYAGADDDA
jgi:hypothetical protein